MCIGSICGRKHETDEESTPAHRASDKRTARGWKKRRAISRDGDLRLGQTIGARVTILRDAGERVVNVSGGLSRWQAEGLPAE